jgi:two-component system chemotaxis response regulator CheB
MHSVPATVAAADHRPATRDHLALAQLLVEDQRVLGASAVPAGLAHARPRSGPDRLPGEASRFVRFLARALTTDAAPELVSAAPFEVRAGCLAAATPEEIGPVFAVWNRVLRAYLPSVGRSDQRRTVRATLRQMESAALAAARRWEGDRLDLIVLGASAGGIHALSEVVAALDAAAPITIAIVLHIGPDDRGILPLVLARQSRLSIAAAVDGARLYLGHAYIAPPGHHLTVTRDAFHVVQGPRVHFVKPAADVLFESAAEAFGRHVASVVLSGTGRDGAAGTCAIHEHGGVTFCQDPETAEFGGMPEAALATGRVDHKLALAALVEALVSAATAGRTGHPLRDTLESV